MIYKLADNTPTLVLNPQPNRSFLLIQLQSTSIDAANTGKIFIGYSRQPVATVGDPHQGDVLTQAAYILKTVKDGNLKEEHRGQIWIISDMANQTVLVEELTESEII